MGAACGQRSILIPAFDERSRWAYITLLAMFSLGCFLIFVRGFTYTLTPVKVISLVALWILSAGLLRRFNYPRLATWLEASALAYGHGLPAFMVLAPAASFALPVVDGQLAAIDQAMGLDWVATVYALRPYLYPLKIAYFSFAWQPTVAIALLAIVDPTRCWRYVTAGIMCGLVTGFLFIFFPAYGAFHHYGIQPADYPPFTSASSPWNWMANFERLRDGYNVIDGTVAGSLVSFPSYHAAVAALTIWALWPLGLLRVPIILLNLGLLLGALIFGTHHFIDLIAGTVLAVTSVLIVNRLVQVIPPNTRG